MNSKAIYAAGGGIAAAAIALFFVLGSGNVLFRGQTYQGATQNQLLELQLSIQEISAKKIDDRNAEIQIIFNARNPNKNTAILETIHYSIYVGQNRMTLGDIGVSPEGFVASQEGIFPIVANTTVALKDTRVAVRNNLTANSWDSAVEGTAQYRVEGTYAYKLTGTGFQFNAGEKDFTLTFP